MHCFPFVSTKTYQDAFPVAYRQWRADSHCNQVHGYALTVHIEFGCTDLDARNWCVDYGSLRPLKGLLEDWFDHKLLVASDDPQIDLFRAMHTAGIAKITEVAATGCEALADFVFNYINDCWLKDYGYAGRVVCTEVQVRETQSNMAKRIWTGGSQ